MLEEVLAAKTSTLQGWIEMNGEKVRVIPIDHGQAPETIEKELEEAQATARFLLREMETDMKVFKENFAKNIKKTVLPYLIALRETNLNQMQLEFVKSIEYALSSFSDPMMEKVISDKIKLSPTEIRVASFIRDGKTNKEIATILNLSLSTILTHRHRIREKMGLKFTKTNLHSYLNYA